MKPASYAGCLLAICLMPAVAQAQVSYPWDFRFDIGGSIPQDPDLENAPGELDLNPGFTMNLGIGYRLQPWLQIGPEIGFNYNTIDSINDLEPRSDADLFQMPMMFNVMVEYPPDSPLRPYAGVGVGGVISTLSSRYGYYGNYYYYWEDYESDMDAAFAVQAFAGIRYDISEQMSLGLMYRFLATGNQDWSYTDRIDWWQEREYSVSVDSIQTHSISLLLSWQF